jgi:hypothetical protein
MAVDTIIGDLDARRFHKTICSLIVLDPSDPRD